MNQFLNAMVQGGKKGTLPKLHKHYKRNDSRYADVTQMIRCNVFISLNFRLIHIFLCFLFCDSYFFVLSLLKSFVKTNNKISRVYSKVQHIRFKFCTTSHVFSIVSGKNLSSYRSQTSFINAKTSSKVL